MPEVKKIAEMILLSRTQREIQLVCHASPKTIVKVRRMIEESGRTSPEILSMGEEELRDWIFPVKPRKLRKHICMPPDITEHVLTILQGKTVKESWARYYRKALEAGKRPLKYSAYCSEISKTGAKDLLSEAQRMKAGLVAFVESEYTITIGGTRYFICLVIFPLSQMSFVVPCLLDNNDAFIEALQDIVIDIGGVPPFICFPKVKAKIKESMSGALSYYGIRSIGFIPDAVNEVVNDADRFFSLMLKDAVYSSEKEAIDSIVKAQGEYNERLCYGAFKSRETLFEELERKELNPLPKWRYERTEEKTAKIQYDYHVSYQNVRYSVPPEAYKVSTNVILYISKSKVTIISEDGELLGEHPHLTGSKVRHSTLPEHIRTSDELSDLPWNAARFRKWAMKFSNDTKEIIDKIISGFKIEQQAYCYCYWILKRGEKMMKEGRLDEFILACRGQKKEIGIHSYYLIKNRLEKG